MIVVIAVVIIGDRNIVESLITATFLPAGNGTTTCHRKKDGKDDQTDPPRLVVLPVTSRGLSCRTGHGRDLYFGYGLKAIVANRCIL